MRHCWSLLFWICSALGDLVNSLGFNDFGIDCFECFSLDGSSRECEDEFGPINRTAHLLHRNCRVGEVAYRAHFCVKIKGIKENGQTVMIRTCSRDDWGTQCGDILVEQGLHSDEQQPDKIIGCLATCNFDGCNAAHRPTIALRNLIHTVIFFLLWFL